MASPEQAAPDPEILSLLGALGASPRLVVEIVSGRPPETLEAWLGHMPLALSAEHGLRHRPGPDAPWTAALNISPDWTSRVRPILDQFVATTPGSHVETKSATIGWHYRQAQPEFGARQARELRMMLGQALANQPFEVLEGKKVIEVRVRGVSKALVAHRMQADPAARAVVLAMGDDRTDEDLFRALPPSSLTVAVGDLPARARFRLDDHRAVRDVLRSLLDQSGGREERDRRAGDGAEADQVTLAGRR
jgi:trehalose 6-phosphate synthase/phosphatase